MFVAFRPATSPTEEAIPWADDELADAAFGDARLTKRARKLVQQVLARPQMSLPAACATRAETKAAYQFFSHPKVTPAKILAPHQQHTWARIATQPVALLVQDLSYLDYTHKVVAQELGLLGNRKTRGLVVAPLLALTPTLLALGVAAWETWCRDPTLPPSESRCATQPLEEKESAQWVDTYTHLCDRQAELPTTTLVYVADRGSDLFPLYQQAQTHATPARFVIRRCYDRVLAAPPTPHEAGAPPPPRKVSAALAAAAPCGEVTLTLAATPTRTARTATLTVRAVTVTLTSSKHPQATATVHVVHLRETGTTPPGEAPVEWTLFTNLPITTFAEIQAVIEYYLARWQVELFFKILKSGCGVEKLYLQTAARLRTALALYVLVAWRVLYLTQIGRIAPTVPCTVVFTDAEWRAAYTMAYRKPPTGPPISLQEMLLILGSFGGFYPRKGRPAPGITSLWIGLQRLQDFTAAYELMTPTARSPTKQRQ